MKFILTLLITLFVLHTASAEKTEWTYAFYLASGDGLYLEQNNNFQEICRGAEKLKNARVVVFIDVEPEKGKISSLKLKKGTYVFEVKSCSETLPLEIPEIGLLRGSDLDSSDADVIRGFFSYVKKQYISWKYFYLIAAHGDPLVSPKQGRMNPANIAKALEGNKADVLALDMCYGGTMASLWELRRSAAFITASGTTIPLSLNNYDTFLTKADKTNYPAGKAAEDFINSYKETYSDKRFPVSVFALETGDRFEGFAELFDQRARCFDKKIDRFPKIKPKQSAKSNLYGSNTDMLSALHVINRMLEKRFEPLITASFSHNSDFKGPALFMPMDADTYRKLRDAYHSTSYSKDKPGWPLFLDTFYIK